MFKINSIGVDLYVPLILPLLDNRLLSLASAFENSVMNNYRQFKELLLSKIQLTAAYYKNSFYSAAKFRRILVSSRAVSAVFLMITCL